MLEIYKYEGREYRGTDLPELARKTFGDEIYEELVRQIKDGVAYKKRTVDYINLTELEQKVWDYKNGSLMGVEYSYRDIGNIIGKTPAETMSIYNTAKKKKKRNVPGHISVLNIPPRAANALITEMNGNTTLKELATAMAKLPNAFIKCDGLGYVGYCDVVNELERHGFDMSSMPRFENKSQFALYRARL